MIRSRVVALLFAFGLLASLPAAADEFGAIRPWSGRLGLGWTIPTSPVSDYINDGFNFTGGFGYYLQNSPVGFRIDFLWSWHDLTKKSLDLIREHTSDPSKAIGYTSTRLSYVSGDLVLHTKQRGPAQLYFMGGIGAYNRYIEIGDVVGWATDPWYPWWGSYPIYGTYFSDSKVAFGYNIGGGIDLSIGHGQGSLYFEGGYHSTTHSPTPIEFVPLQFGYRW